MKQKPFFKPILLESWRLTWQHKPWWFISFLALFLTSYLGYQLILQNLASLTRPEQWLNRWQVIATWSNPLQFFSAQWHILVIDPKGWLAMILVWTIMLAIIFLIFSISAYATTMIIAAVRFRKSDGKFRLGTSFVEAWVHFKSVLAAFVLVIIISITSLLVFSLPIVWLGVGVLQLASTLGLILVFALFAVVSFFITMITIYTLMYVIWEDATLSTAISAAWGLLKKYWLISVEMMILHIFFTAIIIFIVALLISLLVVTVTLVGVVLVASQQYGFFVLDQ